MWAQRLQRNKFVLIFLIVLLLVFSFQVNRPQAIGLDTAVKIVAGSSAQKVVRSIGEKAGMAFTPKSLDAATDYINGQAAKGNVQYIDFAKKVNTAAAAGTVDTAKPGWKKYLLDPVLWLTGADLLVEMYDAFNDAQTAQTPLNFYGTEVDGYGLSVDMPSVANSWTYTVYHKGIAIYGFRYTNFSTMKNLNPRNVVYEVQPTYFKVTCQIFNGDTVIAGESRTVAVDTIPYKDDREYTKITSDDDEYEISNVHNADTYRTKIDNDDYSKVTYDNDIEIYAPDTDITYNNDYTTPWNTRMPDDEFTLIVQPITDVDVVVPPPVVDGDDDLPTGPRPDPVEVIDRSMLDVARQSYDYLGDSVDTAISSMRDVTDNVTGLITFLDDTFDWLPQEWRSLFGAAFILGVFAHFFRR